MIASSVFNIHDLLISAKAYQLIVLVYILMVLDY